MNRKLCQIAWYVRLSVIASLSLAIAGCGGSESLQTDSIDEASSDQEDASNDAYCGIKLGEYFIREFHQTEGLKSTLRFTLHAGVVHDKRKECEELMENRKHKVRDQVILASRLVPVTEYDDPELLKFRRRILLRLQRTLPELLVQEIYFSDFNYSTE